MGAVPPVSQRRTVSTIRATGPERNDLMEDSRQSNVGLLIAIVFLLLVILLTLPTQLPRVQDIQLQPHAVQKHGTDAVQARSALSGCGDNLNVRICPPSSAHGLSIVFWCETGGFNCPGMYATIGGQEKTCFIRPCSEWRECR